MELRRAVLSTRDISAAYTPTNIISGTRRTRPTTDRPRVHQPEAVVVYPHTRVFSPWRNSHTNALSRVGKQSHDDHPRASTGDGSRRIAPFAMASTRLALAPTAPARSVASHPRARVVRSASASSEHVLPDGVVLERVIGTPASSTTTTGAPLVFVHGSYHAAWCYEEYFARYFNARGRATVSVSLRAHGASGTTPGRAAAGTLAEHARDVGDVIERGMGEAGASGRAPVLVGHSFGGLVAQRVAADDVRLGGLALLASVPPSGNGAMVKRFLKRDLWASLKITYAFITKAFGKNASLCRECFFSPDLPERDVERFMKKIDSSGALRMFDLKTLDAELPVPRPSGTNNRDIPILVLGGDRDFVVDREGLEETARWYGAAAALDVLGGVAHDVMLDRDWERAARALENWLIENDL